MDPEELESEKQKALEDQQRCKNIIIKFGLFEQTNNQTAIDMTNKCNFTQEEIDALFRVDDLVTVITQLAHLQLLVEEYEKKCKESDAETKYWMNLLDLSDFKKNWKK